MKLISKIILYPILTVNVVIDIILLLSCFGSLFRPFGTWPFISLTELAFPFLVIINILFLGFWLVFWRKGIIISLITFLICLRPCLDYCPLHIFKNRTEAEKGEIKILSYNTEGLGTYVNSDNTVNNPVLKYIAASGADIVCLQESNNKTLKRLNHKKDFLPEYPYKYFGTEMIGLACFSKFPIISNKKINFEKSTGNSCGYYRILIENDTVAVYNCHLQSNGLKKEEIEDYHRFMEDPSDDNYYSGSKSVLKKLLTSTKLRAEQADLISKKIGKETAKYVIVCGDFNDTPISYAHRTIEKNLTDAYSKSGFGLGISYNRHKLFYRIDHILVSNNLKPINCWVDKSIKDSDHYPILSVLSTK
jgi:exonuclease III